MMWKELLWAVEGAEESWPLVGWAGREGEGRRKGARKSTNDVQ